MSNRHLVASAFALAVSLLPALVLADATPINFKSSAKCVTEKGSEVVIPPGKFLPNKDWLELDEKWRKLEDDNTRLVAENEVYIGEQTVLGWKSALSALIVGVSIGAYIWRDK